MEETHYLYKITNLINGKLYIGVTKDPKHRKDSHFSKGQRLVNKAYEKYGKEGLNFEVICEGSKDYIYDLEVKAIELYNSDASMGHGYNVCSGGFKGDAGNKGRKHQSKSDDTPYYVSGFWFPNKRTALTSLNWGDGRFNSRKKLGVLGNECVLKKLYKTQHPVYASGFWFPSHKTACTALNITNTNTFYNRRKRGTLGDTETKVAGSVYGHPIYFRGFWFPDVRIAASAIDRKEEYIQQCIRRGLIEESSRTKTQHPTRVPCVNGVIFRDVREAADKLGIPYNTIRHHFCNNKEGFYYEYTTN